MISSKQGAKARSWRARLDCFDEAEDEAIQREAVLLVLVFGLFVLALAALLVLVALQAAASALPPS